MVQPLLNLGDAAHQETKKKKKPFSRPRKSGDGDVVARVVAKKPKEPKQPVAVQPVVPEKKSQKRKYVAPVFRQILLAATQSYVHSQEERKVQGKAQGKAPCRINQETRGQKQAKPQVVFWLPR